MQPNVIPFPEAAPSTTPSPAPTPAIDYLFDRDRLIQELLNLATHQYVCARNVAAAHQLCSAAYLASLPRERTSRSYPDFQSFWWSFRTCAQARLETVSRGGSGGASA